MRIVQLTFLQKGDKIQRTQSNEVGLYTGVVILCVVWFLIASSYNFVFFFSFLKLTFFYVGNDSNDF